MFGEDPFAEIFNQLAGGRRSQGRSTKTQSQSLLNTVESKKETILIFDLSGKKIASVTIEDDWGINEYGERAKSGEKALTIRFEKSDTVRYALPKDLAKRKVEYNFTNGILEVFLRK